MKLSFVIPAYNEEGYIGKCLDSIFDGLRAGNYDAEVIVVNNASTDRTREIAGKYPGIKIVDEPEKGIVRARRAGFLAATGDIIANVDADTVLTSGWIKKVFEEFSKNQKLVALSGPFIYYDLPKSAKFLVKIFYYISFITYILNRFIFNLGSVLQGGNFILKRSALESIGGYDTNIEFYGEDTDLARRLHKIGPVKFTFGLPIYASGRRLAKEGMFTIGLRYGINYFWTIFFKKPFNNTSIDIRTSGNSGLERGWKVKVKEWLIASASIMIFCAFLAGAGFLFYYLMQAGIITFITVPEIKADAQKIKNTVQDFSKEIMNGTSPQLKQNESAQ